MTTFQKQSLLGEHEHVIYYIALYDRTIDLTTERMNKQTNER